MSVIFDDASLPTYRFSTAASMRFLPAGDDDSRRAAISHREVVPLERFIGIVRAARCRDALSL